MYVLLKKFKQHKMSFQSRIPLKWMAPESLELNADGKREYSMKAEVWTFGILIWEIYSLGFFNLI